MPEEPQIYEFKRKVGHVDETDLAFLRTQTAGERDMGDFRYALTSDYSCVIVTSLNGATSDGIEYMMGNYGFVPVNPRKRAAKPEATQYPTGKRRR